MATWDCGTRHSQNIVSMAEGGVMTSTEGILWGCLGGVLPDGLRLVGARYGAPPEYLKRAFFWFSLSLLIGVAALTVFLLSPSRIIDAIALGFSAPEILSSVLASKKPRRIVVRKREMVEDPDRLSRSRGELTDALEENVNLYVRLNERLEARSFLSQVRAWWGSQI
jgi:hypothetical protein